MPLSCLNGDKLINSFLLENEEWARLRLHYREMNLTMPCCKSAVVPKESKYGTPFFAHKARGGCTVNESPEHLLAKYTIACAIKETSWSVSTEVSGTNPDGEPWIADVLCDNGEKKVAFEVQLSPQNHDEYERRQQKYQESGIKCFWFKKKRKNGPTLHDDKELPIFLLDVSNPPSFLVNLNCRGSDKQIELGCFVKGVLNHDLKWRSSIPN